jgi:O-antigen ligase
MLLVNRKNINGETLLSKVGFAVLILFSLILFQSKALVNIFGVLAVLLSFSYICLYDRKIIQNSPYLLLFLLPFAVGFLLSFFSTSGVAGAIAFWFRFKFLLLIIPLAVFIKTREDLHLILGAVFISAIIAVSYGIYSEQQYGAFRGFHKIGRTSDMMTVAWLTGMVYLVHSGFTTEIKTIVIKGILATVVAFFGWAILMSEIRGSWLGAGIGFISFLALLLISKNRSSIVVLGVIVCFAFSFYLTNFGGVKHHIARISQQVESIVDTESNVSNNARLHLWRTGWDFSQEQFLFGTGAKQSEGNFIKFIESQPDDYQQKYRLALQYPGDYHNSYLQILIETGIIFLVVYMLGLCYSLFVIFKNISKVSFADQKYLIASVIASFSFLITQFFHNDLYHYGSTIFYIVLFSGCFVLNKNNTAVWFPKRLEK